MASELEPETPALDRSLLECSAEETAGVSAGTPAGTSVPWQAEPRGRNRLLEAPERPGSDVCVGGSPGRWLLRPPRLGSGPGTPPSLPHPPLFILAQPADLRCARPPSRSLSAQESQQLFHYASFPPRSPEVPNTRALALDARSRNRGRKRHFLVFWV